MCNLYEQMIAWGEYCAMMQGLEWRVPAHQGELDLPERHFVKITDPSAAIVIGEETGEPWLTAMSFGWPAAKQPVFNLRSEGRDFSRSLRCIVPMSAFFEHTKPADPKKKRKDRWRFTRADGGWMGAPALWKPGEDNRPPSLTLPTVNAGPDVGALHKRQIVIAEPEQWKGWLVNGDKAAFAPSPAGTFKVAGDDRA